MTDAKRFDGYGRVSRRQGRTGLAYISPAVQRDGVERWAQYANVIIDQWHFDEDKTGRNQNRPGMREAVRRVEAGEVHGIVCLRLNRFARNVIGALDDIRRIKEAGGEIVFVEDQIDTSGASGQLMLTVMLAVAEWEHENFSANFREAKIRAVARGAYVSRTPWGYARNQDGTLSPHPIRGPVVSEAFRLAAGDSFHAAMSHLRHTAPERNWTATKVRRLLSQRSYLGDTHNGDLTQRDTHDPLVSRAIWEAAQTAPAKRAPHASFPLSGLLRCATCGGPMVGARGGKGQRTYRCAATYQSSPARCERGANVTALIAEEHLEAVAGELLAGMRAIVGDPEADTLTLLERAIGEAEAELDAFAGDLTLRRALADRYHDHLQARVDAVEEARGRYREHARRAQAQIALHEGDLPLELKLRGMFAAIVVKPGRGIAIADRLTLVPFDADGAAGVAGAEMA